MTDEQLKKELLPIMEGLSESVLFDDEGEIVGYMTSHQVKNHQELLDKKNQLIKDGEMIQDGFALMLFNFEECRKEIKGVDRISIELKNMRYSDLPTNGL